jgi:hypothetical protein
VLRYQYDEQGNLIRIEPDQNDPQSVLEIGRARRGGVSGLRC